MNEKTRKNVDALDAARMTATSSSETASRVSQYFGDAGPFSYQKVRRLTPVLLSGEVPYRVATAGIEKIVFDLARTCNLDVAKLVASCNYFRGKTFYELGKKLYFPIDRNFSISLKPETVAVIDGVPNLIFLQPRKTPTPWSYNVNFLRTVLEQVYSDYYDEARYWIVDTEADENGARFLNLIDLSTVSPMPEREFIRRVAALRTAWRLHLSSPTAKRRKDKPKDDTQGYFDGFEPEE